MKNKKKAAFVAILSAFLCISAGSLIVYGAVPEPSDRQGMVVIDKDQTWTNNTQINLFEENELGNRLVYPGVAGKYSFTVKNTGLYDHNATVRIQDTNDFHIPLDIRMKRDGVYVLGNEDNWVDSATYESEDYLMKPQSDSVYEIEWKWDFEAGQDPRDTSLGYNAHFEKEPYLLNITVNAEFEPSDVSVPVPESSVPESSVPESSVPESSVPESSVPESSAPESSASESSVPTPSHDVSDPSFDPSNPGVIIQPSTPTPPDGQETVITGDQSGILIGSVAAVAAVSAGVVAVLSRKKKKGDDE